MRRLPLSVDQGPFPEVDLRPLGSGDWLASPEEGLMPFRSDPGLGGASWAAMMRPHAVTTAGPSSPCSTTTARTGIAAALPVRQQLQGVPLELHRVVPGHSSLRCLKHRTCPRRRSGGKGFSECRIRTLGGNLETPVEPGQELLQYGLGLFNRGCSGQPEFRDQPVLEGSRGTFHPSFGLG